MRGSGTLGRRKRKSASLGVQSVSGVSAEIAGLTRASFLFEIIQEMKGCGGYQSGSRSQIATRKGGCRNGVRHSCCDSSRPRLKREPVHYVNGCGQDGTDSIFGLCLRRLLPIPLASK